MAYANCTDLEQRWRTLTADEQVRASALLDDASNVLTALVDVDDNDEQQKANLRQVCCNMVIRSMIASASEAFGIEQMQATMGPFGQSVHYANPSGDLYLTRLEKKLLGIGGRGRMLQPNYGPTRKDLPTTTYCLAGGDDA